jgi:hypothetical protein
MNPSHCAAYLHARLPGRSLRAENAVMGTVIRVPILYVTLTCLEESVDAGLMPCLGAYPDADFAGS